MKTRNRWVVALFLLAGAGGHASAADMVPLSEMTKPWLGLLRSSDIGVRDAAGAALADIVRKHPAAAIDVVRHMAAEENGVISNEHERRLVPLAKVSPATVSAVINIIKEKNFNYRVRNFCVKVLSQVGPAAATPEFVEALSENYCPVPGAYLRVLRAMGKDSAPVLAAAYRHPNEATRRRATAFLRMIGRNEPTIQKLLIDLQAEGGLLSKLRDGTQAERIAAVTALVEMAPTTPGTTDLLAKFLQNETDTEVLTVALTQFVRPGRK